MPVIQPQGTTLYPLQPLWRPEYSKHSSSLPLTAQGLHGLQTLPPCSSDLGAPVLLPPLLGSDFIPSALGVGGLHGPPL